MMSSLKKNLIYNTAYQILILIVPFVTSPYVSRVFGPEGLGTYSVTTAIVKYFTLFALLGMTNYGNRTIAKNKGNKETLSITFWNLYYFQLLFSSFVLIIYVVYVITIGEKNYGIVSVCQIPYMLSTVFEVSWFFYGMENFKGIVSRNAIVKVATMIAVFTFVKTREDVWIYVLINALSLLFGQLCLWPFVAKYVTWKKPDWKLVRSHFKPNCVLMVSVIAVSIYTLMDKIMIELLSNTKEVGYYENTEKILTIANNAAGAIGAVMLPRISNLRSKGDDKQVLYYISKSMKYIMIVSIALAFGIASVSHTFSVVYFGNEFEICSILLKAIAPAIIFYAWSNIIRNQFLLPNDMDSVFVVATITASIVNLVLNGIFIPRFGALGAVIGTVGAQFSELTYQTLKVKKLLPIKKYCAGLIPFIISGVIMFICCNGVENLLGVTSLALLVQICVGVIVYGSFATIYLYLTKDELVIGLLKKCTSKMHL